MAIRHLWRIEYLRPALQKITSKQTVLRRYNVETIKRMAPTKTLKDFGYSFNCDGQLRKLDKEEKLTDEPFQFFVSNNHQECQKHYEELGTIITDHVYTLLDQENLIRLPVPVDSASGEGTFVYVSKDYDKKDQLLVLIHGSGVVRAGQWARSLIINDCVDTGTQIPYIRRAVSKGYGVLIMNTNDNFKADGSGIEESSQPEEHAVYVWDNYVTNTSAASIGIVAHSYGGVVTLDLAAKRKQDFERRVKAVAFTDSVHNFSELKVTKFLKEVARNWVSSSYPLDKPVQTPEHDITRVSAGHPKHEMTSSACINSVFKFIEDKFKQ